MEGDEGSAVSDEAMTVIASRFISVSKKSILPLMRTITETLKRHEEISDYDKEEDIDDQKDGDGGSSDTGGGQDQPPIQSFSTLNLKGAAMTSAAENTKTQAASRDRDNSSKKSSSGKGGGGQGKRRSLVTLEPNIMLTEEALYHHNKNKFIVW